MNETVVCVGAVVRRAKTILLVRQSAGHSLEGQWTIPWGQLGQGESPSKAAVREIQEEAGVVGVVDGLLGVQELPKPWVGMIGLIYLCRHVDGDPTPDHQETDAARYFDAGDFEMLADPLEPLSAWLIRRVLDGDYTLVRSDTSNPFAQSIGYI